MDTEIGPLENSTLLKQKEMWAPEPTALLGAHRQVSDWARTSDPEPTLWHNTAAVLPELLREKQCHYYDTPNIWS